MSLEEDKAFERALEALASDQRLEALRLFELAHARDPAHAECASYVALLNAVERGRVREAVDMAIAAAQAAPRLPIVHLNLGRIHLKAGDKHAAIAALRLGLKHNPGERALLAQLGALGVRRPPIFKALPRRHPLNKYLGLIAARLRLR